MTLSTDDMQATGIDDVVMQRLPFIAQCLRLGLLIGIRQSRICFDDLDLLFNIAAQHDVGTTTGHVGGDGDHLRTTSLRNDFGFAGMLLGVEHVVLQLGLGENAGQQLGIFNRGRTNEHRLTTLVAILNVLDHRHVLFLRGFVHLILTILTGARTIRRNHHGFEVVDFLEFVGFSIGSTGHAGELAVHTEIVLESDRSQCLVLVLDLDLFLGFDGLMQTI